MQLQPPSPLIPTSAHAIAPPPLIPTSALIPLPHPQAHKLQEQADVHKAAEDELRRGLDAVHNARTTSELQKEVIDTARRMAVVQVSGHGEGDGQLRSGPRDAA